jgi:transposase
MARPTKCTAEITAAIAQRIADGNFPDVAAQCEGVGKSTFYAWMQRGEAESEGPFREFVEAVTRAEAEFEDATLEKVRTAVDQFGNAKNAAWLLERRNRDRWGQSIDVRVRNDAIDAVLARLRAGLDQESYARCVELLATGEGEG